MIKISLWEYEVVTAVYKFCNYFLLINYKILNR
mgnify:FL=1